MKSSTFILSVEVMEVQDVFSSMAAKSVNGAWHAQPEDISVRRMQQRQDIVEAHCMDKSLPLN